MKIHSLSHKMETKITLLLGHDLTFWGLFYFSFLSLLPPLSPSIENGISKLWNLSLCIIIIPMMKLFSALVLRYFVLGENGAWWYARAWLEMRGKKIVANKCLMKNTPIVVLQLIMIYENVVFALDACWNF